MQAKPVLGIVGGIGSGKSQVAAALARHRGHLITADQLGHEALRQPDIRDRVVARFGADICDAGGAIDRRKLGRRVFSERRELRALEGLVFPFIEGRIRQEIAGARSDAEVEFIVLDAAVMLEAGWQHVCDALVFVDVPRKTRLERLARDRGWSDSELAARERFQMSPEEKKRRADFVVDNSAGIDVLASQVRDLLGRLGLGRR